MIVARWTAGVLSSLLLTGCAVTRPSELALAQPSHAMPVELAGQGRTLSMLARPSAEVARLMAGDRYRVVLEGPDAITLVLLDERDQPRAFFRLAALDQPSAIAGWTLDFEDLGVGIEGRIELWTVAERLHGDAQVGERSASWRARFEADGKLSPERWKVEPERDLRATTAIRRARAIGRDLASLATELDASLTDESSCRIVEAIANVELALELALRAYEGRGRSELPVWTGPELADACG